MVGASKAMWQGGYSVLAAEAEGANNRQVMTLALDIGNATHLYWCINLRPN